MMILVAVVIAVVILAMVLAGPLGELQERRRNATSRRRLEKTLGQHFFGAPGTSGDWWPDFERQFRSYVREHEREAH
jgi:hypothetical protein